MADEFDEWDRFIEAFENAPTAEDAMLTYKTERKLDGRKQDWDRLRKLGNLRRIAKRRDANKHLASAGIVFKKTI
jgi:hypothetical protein